MYVDNPEEKKVCTDKEIMKKKIIKKNFVNRAFLYLSI